MDVMLNSTKQFKLLKLSKTNLLGKVMSKFIGYNRYEDENNDDDQTIGNTELRLTREYYVWSCLIQLLFGTYFYLNFQYLKLADYSRT